MSRNSGPTTILIVFSDGSDYPKTMSNIILETDRLVLRKIEIEDADALFQIQNNSDVMRYAINGPSSEEGVFRFIHATLNRYETDGIGQWAVVEKLSNTVIGDCGFSIKDIDRIREHDLSYRFSRKYWGKGFATEAATACRNYAFKNLNLDRIISIQDKDNKLSHKVLHKIGMLIKKEITFHHKVALVYGMNRP